ncbi:hypothetical protein B1A90_12685, partial [Neisseria meningitidis]
PRPAPTAAPREKTSWWDSFKAWLKRIFGGSETRRQRRAPHPRPAPTAAPREKTSWWDSFKAWLKRIFGGSET